MKNKIGIFLSVILMCITLLQTNTQEINAEGNTFTYYYLDNNDDRNILYLSNVKENDNYIAFDTASNENSETPWDSTIINEVIVKNEIFPVSTAYWFYGSRIIDIDVTNINAKNLIDVTAMFKNCTLLSSIYTDDTDKFNDIKGFENMFDGSLFAINENRYLVNEDAYSSVENDILTSESEALTEPILGSDDSFSYTNNVYYVLKQKTIGNVTYEDYELHLTTKKPDSLKPKDWKNYKTLITKIVIDDEFEPLSCESMFSGLVNAVSIEGIQRIITTNTTDMSYMFKGCSSLTKIDASSFNTSNVKKMYGMFDGCSSLVSLDVSGFDTSKVETMANMFNGCSSLEVLDVSGFKTSNVTNMSSMFGGCSSLNSLDVSCFDTSNVESFGAMFYNCSKLTEIDISDFVTSKAVSINGMFSGCKSVLSLNVSGFDTSNVKNIYTMFAKCASLTSLDLKNFDTSKVTSMSWMFSECTNLETIYVSDNFITEHVITSEDMFYKCEKLIGGNGTEFNSNNIDVTYARYDDINGSKPGYFTKNHKLILDINGGSLNGEEKLVKDLAQGETYGNLPVPEKGDGLIFVGWFDEKTGGNVVTSETIMGNGETIIYVHWAENNFYWGLEEINGSSISYNLHLSSNSLTDLTKINGYVKDKFSSNNSQPWDGYKNRIVSIVIDNELIFADTGYLFSGLSAAKSFVDLNKINTVYVQNMNSMFSDCSSLEYLDISTFNTSSTVDMTDMFLNCSKLETIKAYENFDLSNVIRSKNMFLGCLKLVGGNGTLYNKIKTDAEYARFDDTNQKMPGYFTRYNKLKFDTNGTSVANESTLYKDLETGKKIGFLPKSAKNGYVIKWNTKKDGTGKIVDNDTVMNDGDMVVYGQYELEEFYIEYNLNEGVLPQEKSNPSSYTIITETFNLLSPTKDGFTFSGWYDQNNKKITSIKKGSYQNYVLNAIYTENTYKVAYNLNGGKGSLPKTISYKTSDNVLITDIIPVKTGYTFKGWSTSKLSSVVDYKMGENAYGINNNAKSGSTITLYAVWEPVTYTVVFDADDKNALGAMHNQVLTYDKSEKLNANMYANPGYVFNGWTYINPINNKKITVKDAATVKNILSTNSTIVLKANWKKSSYSIKYNLNGGALAKGFKLQTSYEYRKDSADNILLPLPERTGYVFAGWYKDSEFAVAIDPEYTMGSEQSISYSSYENLNLYAKWKPISYKVKFVGNNNGIQNEDVSYGETDSDGYITVFYDDYITLTNLFIHKRNDVKFSNWTVVINGKSVSFKNNGKVKNITAEEGTKIVITANWLYSKNLIYKLTYVLNGGKNNPENISTYNVDTPEFSLKPPTKAGYDFAGWYRKYSKDSKNNTELYEDKVISLKGSDRYNGCLYAKWVPITYKVVFDANDENAIGSMEDQVLTYDVSEKLNPNSYVKPGYAFNGWTYINPLNNKSVTVKDNTAVKNLVSCNSSIVLKANWKLTSYSIKYILTKDITNGKSNISSYKYTNESRIYKLNNPIKKGYRFRYWEYTDISGVKKQIVPVESSEKGYSYLPSGLYGNLALVPIFENEPEKYEITYVGIDEFCINNNDNFYCYSSNNIVLNNPVRTGYTFSGRYLNNKKISGISKGTTGNIAIEAKMNIKKYKVIWKNYDGIVLEA